ncbi:hypothetical protein Cni_G11200 [Canna indica]|uniref:Uncharacterized protein n=1 Tax=Canna indica TaxID=4628 RepID=A0AAQ3Q7Y2_9LILI|nr:hypothetical protein Cni_G11200 [Canna indica]
MILLTKKPSSFMLEPGTFYCERRMTCRRKNCCFIDNFSRLDKDKFVRQHLKIDEEKAIVWKITEWVIGFDMAWPEFRTWMSLMHVLMEFNLHILSHFGQEIKLINETGY